MTNETTYGIHEPATEQYVSELDDRAQEVKDFVEDSAEYDVPNMVLIGMAKAYIEQARRSIGALEDVIEQLND